jgi:hypothetical protein
VVEEFEEGEDGEPGAKGVREYDVCRIDIGLVGGLDGKRGLRWVRGEEAVAVGSVVPGADLGHPEGL